MERCTLHVHAERDKTTCLCRWIHHNTSTLLTAEYYLSYSMDTSYNLHVHSADGERVGHPACTSTLKAVELDTPFKSTLQVLKKDTPCLHG
jgi:hypothetical protein